MVITITGADPDTDASGGSPGADARPAGRDDTIIVTARLPARDAERMDRFVERGEFKSRSDFLRFAVKTTLQDLVRREAEARLVFEDLDDLDVGIEPALPGPGQPAAGQEGRGRAAGRRQKR